MDLSSDAPSSEVSVRPSREGDLAAITAIYAHHVLHGVASFEEVPPTLQEMARRRGDILAKGLPYLVAERDGGVIGYSYASFYRTRSAYRFTLEDSIYIDACETGKGVGRTLLGALIDACAALGYRQMIAVIGGTEQWPSIGLHAALGFSRIGILPDVGLKFSQWLGIVLMQRPLGDGASTVPDADPG